MLKLARRLLASAAAAVAMHPISQAAPPTEPTVQAGVDIAAAEAEAQRIADYPTRAAGISPETLAAYTGLKTVLSDELIALVHGSKRFRNASIDALGSRAELEKFIQERTR